MRRMTIVGLVICTAHYRGKEAFKLRYYEETDKEMVSATAHMDELRIQYPEITLEILPMAIAKMIRPHQWRDYDSTN